MITLIHVTCMYLDSRDFPRSLQRSDGSTPYNQCEAARGKTLGSLLLGCKFNNCGEARVSFEATLLGKQTMQRVHVLEAVGKHNDKACFRCSANIYLLLSIMQQPTPVKQRFQYQHPVSRVQPPNFIQSRNDSLMWCSSILRNPESISPEAALDPYQHFALHFYGLMNMPTHSALVIVPLGGS